MVLIEPEFEIDKRNASIMELSKVEGFAYVMVQNLIDGLHEAYPDMIELLNTNKIKIED